jgi:hypothetical protein
MTITAKLIETTQAEWERWGFSARPLHGRPTIGGTERQTPFVAFVNDYWRTVDQPNWNGNTRKPWSAAFISYCFKKAGAGAGFPYSAGHAGYCSAIVRHPARYPGLAFSDPQGTALDVGDLILAARSGDGCARPPASHAAARTALAAGEWFCSHADIVIAVRAGEVDVIGGNVSDSVTMTTYLTRDGGIHDPRHVWLGVVKNSS